LQNIGIDAISLLLEEAGMVKKLYLVLPFGLLTSDGAPVNVITQNYS
jgi:hypothetical protein